MPPWAEGADTAELFFRHKANLSWQDGRKKDDVQQTLVVEDKNSASSQALAMANMQADPHDGQRTPRPRPVLRQPGLSGASKMTNRHATTLISNVYAQATTNRPCLDSHSHDIVRLLANLNPACQLAWPFLPATTSIR